MKILEITAFSAGICGVWTRVFSESKLLVKRGHEVYVFSSDIKRGTEKKECASKDEFVEGVHIHRFSTIGSFGKNTFFWNFKKQALKLKPDIIITHAYRQYYSTAALKIAKKLNIPCILVSHAPFLEKKLRNKRENIMVWVYDNFFGKRLINNYSKIFTITKWENNFLKKLGVEKNKIIYSPNGIPEEFFKIPIKKEKNNKESILFLGRIAPVKNLEILIKAFEIVLKKFPNSKLKIVGPAEESYLEKLTSLIKELNISRNVIFFGVVYNLQEKIKLIDDSGIFVLPSKREGMPQVLIEAMSREKVVISSKTDGGKEIINSGKNGYLFEIGDERQLAEIIINLLSKNQNRLKKTARTFVKKFSWNILVKKIEKILLKEVKNNKQ